MYEDQYPADILTRLAAMGGSSGSLWETGVYEGRRLYFRARASAGRAWYVDAADIEIERTVNSLANSVYATYSEAGGRVLRTSTSASSSSVTRYGVTRRIAVKAETTNSTQAGYIRDTALADGADPRPRISIRFNALYDAAGARWPLYMARSGDTITVRNLPPTADATVDRIRSFVVAETEYSADDDTLNVTPESPTPRLDILLAQANNQR